MKYSHFFIKADYKNSSSEFELAGSVGENDSLVLANLLRVINSQVYPFTGPCVFKAQLKGVLRIWEDISSTGEFVAPNTNPLFVALAVFFETTFAGVIGRFTACWI